MRLGKRSGSVAALKVAAVGAASMVFALPLTGAGAVSVNHSSGPPVALTGAGSTFDQPFFTLGFYQYNKKINSNVTVTYASIGSGGGQQQIESNTVNFGATDVPMLTADLAKATAGTIVQVPVDLGGEAISYNVSSLPQGLHLTGTVLAEIYLGQITNWDDPALRALNPKVSFPNQAITVVHRADGSGTSYAFTNYLSDVNSTWSSKVGVGKTVAWPVGVGGQGNEGVAGLVADTPGAIGYVELDYALVNHFKYFAMQNLRGKWILPTLTSVADDAALHPHVSSTDFAIDDLGGPTKLAEAAYPIDTYSWLAIYEDQTNATTATAMVDLFEWMTHSGGQKYAKSLDYVPLPAAVQATAQKALQEILGPNGKPLLTKAAIAKYGK
ncbi:MAG TPA: phosphate ABC transporter substrate-binding protein PstS [Acidimicrobiales bacterium]